MNKDNSEITVPITDDNLKVRVVAMPKDTNYRGDIFGGWTLSQMDLAAGYCGSQFSDGPVATVRVEKVNFYKPIYVGDIVSIYAQVVKVGRTSMVIDLEVWRLKRSTNQKLKTNDGQFIMVAIDENVKPRVIDKKL